MLKILKRKKNRTKKKKKSMGEKKIRYKAQTFSSLYLNKWGDAEIRTRLRVSHEPCGHSGGTGGGGELPRKSLNRRNRPVGPSLGQETPVPGPARRGVAEGRAGPGAGGGSSPRRGWGIAPSALTLLPHAQYRQQKPKASRERQCNKRDGGSSQKWHGKGRKKKKKGFQISGCWSL